MKKFIYLLTFLVFACIAKAKPVQVNGIYYNLYSDFTAAVTSSSIFGGDYSGDVIIPSSIVYEDKKYSVTSISGGRVWKDGYNGGAFGGCGKMTSITIPESIEYIGSNAFYGCSKQLEVHISSLNKWCQITFGKDEMYNFYTSNPISGRDLYVNGQKVEDLVIPSEISSIKEGAFIGGKFKSVTFHSGMSSLGYQSFCECMSLEDVYNYSLLLSANDVFVLSGTNETMSNTTLHIRERYMKQCLTGDWWLFGKIEYIEGIDLHLKYVVDGIEYADVLLEPGEVITPEKEPTKEGYTFSGWEGLPDTMPDHNITVTGSFTINKYKLTYFVDGVEYKEYEVKYDEEIIPETKPTKKGMTFSGWSEIPATMPANDIIVTGTFSWSKRTIDNVVYQVSDTISNNASIIGNVGVDGEMCIAPSVEFDYIYTVTAIADKAFYKQRDITSIIIPGFVTRIGERAFANIDKLNDVYCYAEEVPNTDRTAFENSYIDYVTLHVPASSIKKYKGTGPWKDFKEIAAIPGTEATYTLTYMIDGEIYKTIELKEGEKITPEAIPTKEGYTFSGWSEIPETMPDHDVIVTGTFTINKYKLTYMMDDIECQSYEIEYGAAIEPDPDPGIETYVFLGWNEIPETMPANDVVVTAQYERHFEAEHMSKAIDFILNGNADEADLKLYDLNDDGELNIADIILIMRAMLTGSARERNLTKSIKNNSTKDVEESSIIAENISMKPGEEKALTISLPETINDCAGIQFDLTLPEDFSLESNSEGNLYTISDNQADDIVCNMKDLENGVYRFMLYSSSLKELKGGELLTVRLKSGSAKPLGEYSLSLSNVVLSDMEGQVTKEDGISISVNLTNSFTLLYQVDGEDYKSYEIEYGASITPEAEPTKEGYTFSGWSEIPATMPDHDVTVTGTFTINKYKLIYMVDGEEYKSFDVEYGAIITPEAEPTKEGYTFSGWSYIPSTMPAEDVIITGTFTKGAYKLIYMVDGEVYKTISYDFGDAITPEAEPTKEGYTFSGWSEIPTTMPANDVTVTGTFTINKYKLIYMVDGEEYKSYDVEYGAIITPEAEPTKEGYTFSGWSEIPTTMPANDVTITGTFTINKYTITYIIDNETYKTEEVEYGSTITPPNPGEREGYDFAWVDYPSTMPANDITIYGYYTTGIASILASGKSFDVYSVTGSLLKRQTTTFEGIPSGFYIVNGMKIYIRKQ